MAFGGSDVAEGLQEAPMSKTLFTLTLFATLGLFAVAQGGKVS